MPSFKMILNLFYSNLPFSDLKSFQNKNYKNFFKKGTKRIFSCGQKVLSEISARSTIS